MDDAVKKLFSFFFDFMAFLFGIVLLFQCVGLLSKWLDIYQKIGG